MHTDVFAELSLVIAITAAVSIFMRLVKQPLILGYILAGLLVGPSLFNLIHSKDLFETFSSLGIALLLFIVGLGMNVSHLKKLGKVVLLTATTSLMAITLLGYAASSVMGFNKTESFIIGLALFFSSTIIIVKILSDKKEQNRLHGQVAIGVILTDDVVASFALLFMVAAHGGGLNTGQIITLLMKGALLIGLLIFSSSKLLPLVSKYIANSQELLFLTAISWGFGIATLFKLAGFSIEVGALFSGVALASSPYAREISARLKPLRDFFIVLFFITLGQKMNIGGLSTSLLPALVLSAIVVIGKPLVITATMGLLGYTKRVSFKTGINVSQISEFSIIMVILASNAGLVQQRLVSIITLVAIITIAISAYLMQYDDQLFALFDKVNLHLFEKEVAYREHRGQASHQLVLFGYHHGGHEFIKTFEDIGKSYVVVDYDPGVIEFLETQEIPYIYGDATDIELLNEIGIDKVRLVICTFTDFEVSKQLVASVAKDNPGAVIICHADDKEEALQLYELGSTYVMIPQYIGSEKISSFIRKNGLNKTEFEHFREKHLNYLMSHFEPAEAS
ncbi:cation:proton antiporter [Candidatus Saccharibacteria bacterium]|nr:cation:proton antiporter [Candidatus Saccharibacteria bacterium]